MVSLNLNSLIGNINLARAANLSRPSQTPQESSVSGSTESQDSFTRGQWWKNQAKGESGVGSDLSLYSRVDGAGAALSVGTSTAPTEKSSSAPVDFAPEGESQEGSGGAVADDAENSIGQKSADGEPLGAAELEMLRKLQQADTDVRAHEMAHVAAAGGYAKGGASFTYQKGPDGKRYAVGGEVAIDMGKESSPDATLAKMRVVRQAALAPKDPSPQDQKVAAQATMNIAAAASELQKLATAGQTENPSQVKDISAAEKDEMSPQNRDIFIQNSPASNSSKKSTFPAFKAPASYGQPTALSRQSAGLDLVG